MNVSYLFIYIIDLLLSPFTANFFADISKNKLVSRTIKLYPESRFVKIRFWDAPFIEVEKLIPSSGKILDLGSGEGIFTNFLGISSPRRKVIGIEINQDRLSQAKRGVKNVSFSKGDATKVTLPKCDTVILFHLLHHLTSYKQQDNLLKKIHSSLKKGNKLIIVEAEPQTNFKYLLVWITDHFLVPLIFDKKFYSDVFFRKQNEWKNLLKAQGFFCKIIQADKGKPFSHIILKCTKK